MGSQGFRNIAGNPFVYQEDTRSAAFGLDASAQKWKVSVKATAGALPTDTAQFTIDPATNGDVTIDPNGSGNLVVTSGDVSLTAGNLSLPNSSSTAGAVKINSNVFLSASKHGTASNNISIGVGAGSDWRSAATCTDNIAIGYQALYSMQNSDRHNIGIGYQALYAHDEANDGYNTAVGYQAAVNITGSYNTAFGYSAGSSATGNSDSNIWIRNVGASESNTIRIGTAGSSTGQQSTCYIAGIYPSTVGATNGLVQVDNAHKLGSTNSPSITGTYTTSAGNLALPTSTSTAGQITINGNRFLHAIGSQYNTYAGYLAGNTANGGAYNTFFGEECALALTSVSGVKWEGKYNCGMGAQIMVNATTAQFNTGVAVNTLQSLTSGYFNSAFGPYTVAYRLTTGNYNTFLGISDIQVASDIRYWGAGYNYTSSESSNICIGNAGTTGESNKIRIGSSGSGVGQQNATYIAGIYGVTPGGTKNVALIDSNGQLGSTTDITAYVTGVMSWTEVTGTTQAAAVNKGYITNNGALVTVTLPSTAAVGERVSIVGKGAGLWKLAQNSGQTVHFGSIDSTTGTGGYLAATVRYDCLEVICITANTDWVVRSSVGSITIV